MNRKKWKICPAFCLALVMMLLCIYPCTAAESRDIELKYGNDIIQILDYDEQLPAPDGFNESSVTISKEQRTALKSKTLGLTLVLGEDGSGNQAFYIYEKDSIKDLFQVLRVSGKDYVILSLPEGQLNRVGYKTGGIQLQGNSIQVWKYADEGLEDYYQMYLINEDGEQGIYQYEASEGTLQKIYEDSRTVAGQESVDSASSIAEYELMWDKLEVYFVIAVFVLLMIVTFLIGPVKTNTQIRSKKRAEHYADKIEASYGERELTLDREMMKKEAENEKETKMLDALQQNIYIPELVSAKYDNSAIDVAWKGNDSVQGYQVYRKPLDGKWKCIQKIQDKKITHYVDDCLVTGEVYVYTVRAFVFLGEELILGDYIGQGITEVAIHGNVPKIPALLNIESQPDHIAIQWEENPDAYCYRVYRKEPGGSWDLIYTTENGKETSFTDKEVNRGTAYEYTVRTRVKIRGRFFDSDYENPGLKINYQ